MIEVREALRAWLSGLGQRRAAERGGMNRKTAERYIKAALRDGDLVAWCTVVAVALAVLDVDGRLDADGWLPEHVRLGELEEHLGDGVGGTGLAETAPAPAGPERRRLMSLPLAARLVMAMTLMPNASYVEALVRQPGFVM